MDTDWPLLTVSGWTVLASGSDSLSESSQSRLKCPLSIDSSSLLELSDSSSTSVEFLDDNEIPSLESTG